MSEPNDSATAHAPIDPRIHPQGDHCLIVELGDRIDPVFNARARALAAHLLEHPLPGVLDVVPAFTTVAVHYDPSAWWQPPGPEMPWRRLAHELSVALARTKFGRRETGRVVDIPVCYGGDFGPDLEEVAGARGLTTDEVIGLHATEAHFVYMLGFAPGHPYIGGLDRKLVMPRRTTPRVRVAKGSVAIARELTAIYPIDSPGGWNVIGRTPLPLFLPEQHPPCLLAAGDRVRFVPISLEAFGLAATAPA